MNILITGITGSLGSKVAELLLDDPSVNITGYSRDECKQSSHPLRKKVTLYLGDIRDQTRLVEATRNMQRIYHFAAMKHVDLCEENPEEAIATNIHGTMNVLHAQRVNGIDRVILASTDKAAFPVTLYGYTKGAAEKLVLRNPNNIVCRYGNVLASRGSVVPTFVESLRKTESVNITDSEMSRFWIRLEDAAKFVIDSANSQTGGLKIPKMKAAKVTEIAYILAGILGIKSPKFNPIKIRNCEKIAECLSTEYDGFGYGNVFSNTCEQYTGDELCELLAPIVEAL